jgi:hypothetical protein
VWEFVHYGFVLSGTPPSAYDGDGDGQTDLAEAVFGTNPLNPASRTQVNAPILDGTNAVFTFGSVGGGILYQPLISFDLTASWANFGAPLLGTGLTMQSIVPVDGNERLFFRLSGVLPRPDGDMDSLDAFEEALLGSNDGFANSDTDTLTGLEEFRLQTMGVNVDPSKEVTIPGVRDGEGDADNDGVSDKDELVAGSNPGDNTSYPAGHPSLDSDGDGLKDSWEILHFGDVVAQDGFSNADGDLVNNRQEALLATNPTLKQTNGIRDDGFADQDGDNIIDIWELEDGTDPMNAASADLATNFVVLQGLMEHKHAWGAVADSVAQFSGVTLRAQAIGFENA